MPTKAALRRANEPYRIEQMDDSFGIIAYRLNRLGFRRVKRDISPFGRAHIYRRGDIQVKLDPFAYDFCHVADAKRPNQFPTTMKWSVVLNWKWIQRMLDNTIDPEILKVRDDDQVPAWKQAMRLRRAGFVRHLDEPSIYIRGDNVGVEVFHRGPSRHPMSRVYRYGTSAGNPGWWSTLRGAPWSVIVNTILAAAK